MRNIVFAVSMFFAFAMQGCGDNNETSADIDYGCQTSYQIENLTGKNVKVIIASGYITNKNDSDRDKLSVTVSVAPGLRKEVYIDFKICGENTVITEHEGGMLPIVLDNLSVDIYADNKQISGNIFNSEYWGFSAEEYYTATYLLVITDDLIKSVGYGLLD